MHDLEQAIRQPAYHLWIEFGRQDGQADNYWLAAQREVLSASLGEIGRVIASNAAKSRQSRRRRGRPERTGGLRLSRSAVSELLQTKSHCWRRGTLRSIRRTAAWAEH